MELSMHTSRVTEFTKSIDQLNSDIRKQHLLVNKSIGTGTDINVQVQDAGIQIKNKCEKGIQTDREFSNFKWTAQQEQQVIESLKILLPRMEAALLEGCTPLPLNLQWSSSANSSPVSIQTYQKLKVVNSTKNQIKALACWLSVYTNNAPALVVSTISPHENWCEHMEQNLQLYVPKRSLRSDFVHFQLAKTLPLKGCVQFLSTNCFDKSIFAGSLYDSHIYVWQHDLNKNDLVELHNQLVTEHGCALGLSWAASDILLSVHANGYVLRWRLMTQQMTLESA